MKIFKILIFSICVYLLNSCNNTNINNSESSNLIESINIKKFDVNVVENKLFVDEKTTFNIKLTVEKNNQEFDITDGFLIENLSNDIINVTNNEILALKPGNALFKVIHNEYNIFKEVSIMVMDEIKQFDFTNSEHVNLIGRVSKVTYKQKEALMLVNSASGFSLRFKGTSLKATLASTCNLQPGKGYLMVDVDGVENKIKLEQHDTYAEYFLANNLEDKIHTVKVYKVLEEDYEKIYLAGFSDDVTYYYPNNKYDFKIEFYGDSITAGYGVLASQTQTHNADTEDATKSYAFLTAKKLNAKADIICMQGMSLSIPGYRQDVYLKNKFNYYSLKSFFEYDFKELAEVIVINIGTNDAYGINCGNGTIEKFIDDYRNFINNIRNINEKAHIICCFGMMKVNIPLLEEIAVLVDEFNENGDNKIHFKKLIEATYDKQGAYGHPGVVSQEENADLLAEFIKSIM